MTQLNQVYKCEICGNIVEVLHTGKGTLVCCGQPMQLIPTKTEDQGREKHVPVIERDGNNITVNVGSVSHPMEEKHWIEWIEVIADGRVYRKYLNAGEAPVATFCVDAENVEARAYCNIHGLWQAKQ